MASGSYYLRGYTFETVDANRVAHNEWLRTLYEFGVLGLLLLVLLYAAIFRLGWRVASQHATAEAAVLFGIVLCLFGLLTSQNVFAASIGPHGLVLSFTVARLMCLQTSQEMLVRVRKAFGGQGLAAEQGQEDPAAG